MTPLQARLGVEVFTGVVIASVALALAGLTWRLQGEPGVGPSAAPVAPGVGTASDIRPLIALAPFGTPLAVANVAAGDGTITLKGIFLARPMESSVVLLATADGKIASYGIGAAVGGGVIETIESEQITLRTPGGIQIVGFTPPGGSFPEANAGSLPLPGSPQAGAVPQPVLGVDAVRALIPPSAQGRQPLPPPVPSPMTVAPPQPGMRVGPAPPPALAAAGIRPGDVIQRVNGRTVDAGTNERELMASTLAAGTARVELLRDGQRVSLTIPMR